MQVLVIRHAIAEERAEFAKSGLPDAERPLTEFGRRRMRKNARGLRRLGPRIDVLATSPYSRAAETAQILADTLGIAAVHPVDALTPDQHPSALLEWLHRQPADATVAVVGHEPHVGTLVTWLMSGQAEPRAELKKGGVALLEVGERAEAGRAVLQWLVTPAFLRTLAD